MSNYLISTVVLKANNEYQYFTSGVYLAMRRCMSVDKH